MVSDKLVHLPNSINIFNKLERLNQAYIHPGPTSATGKGSRTRSLYTRYLMVVLEKESAVFAW